MSASLKHPVTVLSHQNLDGRTYFGKKESQLSLMPTSDLKSQYKMLEVYFFLILFYFKTLQYCISFAKYRNESATGIPTFLILNPPPSSHPYPPTGSSQCTSPKHPVSWIEPGLATRFIHDILHVSVPFSQIFPPSPSPIESIRLFCTSVSLLLSRTQGYCYHLSKYYRQAN